MALADEDRAPIYCPLRAIPGIPRIDTQVAGNGLTLYLAANPLNHSTPPLLPRTIRHPKRLLNKLNHPLPRVVSMPWLRHRPPEHASGQRPMVLPRIRDQLDGHAF